MNKRLATIMSMVFIPICVCGALVGCGLVVGWLKQKAVDLAQPSGLWPLGISPIWKDDLSGTITFAPVLTDSWIYAGTTEGVVALDAATGTVKWSRRLDLNNSLANLVVDRGFVAVASQQEVFVLKSETGDIAWQTSPARDSPSWLLSDGKTLYTSDQNQITAFDLANGKLLWRSAEPGGARSSPQLSAAGQHIVVVQAEGRVYSLNADTGQTEWTQAIGDTLYNRVLANGENIIAIGNKATYNIRIADGMILWMTASEKLAPASDIIATNNKLLWDTSSGKIMAADLQKGQAQWSVSTGAEIMCSPLAVAGESLWIRVGYPKSALLRYDLQTGSKLAEFEFKAPLNEPYTTCIGPVATDDRLYLASGSRIAMYTLP